MRKRLLPLLMAMSVIGAACSSAAPTAAPATAAPATAAPATAAPATAAPATAAPATAAPATAAPATAAPATEPPATAAASEAAAATKLIVWPRNYTLNQDEPWVPAVDKFKAAHPGVEVDISGAPYDPQYQRIQLSQAGTVTDRPDIFQMDNIWLGEFTEGGIAANLDSYYANWADASDVAPNYVDSTKWNGSQHAVWFYSDIRLLLWNKDVFKAAGLDPDTGPATWDDLFTMGKAIKDKVPGVTPICFPAASQEGTVDRFYSYLYETGSNILSPDNKTAVFNDAGGQKALQLYVDLIDKGVSSKDALTQDADAVSNAVFAGKCGVMMATVGDGLADRPTDDNGNYILPAEDYASHFGAILPPICSDGCQPASTAGGWMLGINESSPNKDLAWDLVTTVTNGTTMVPFEVQYTRVPVRNSGLALADQFKGDPYFDQAAKAASVAHFPPFVAQYTSMIEFIWTGIQKAVNGDLSVKDALDEAAAGVDALLASAP